MTTVDKISQVVDRGWLVLNQNEHQVETESGQGLSIARLVNRADVWDAIACAVVGDYYVDQGHKQVLMVLASSVGQECTERIQDDQVLLWCVEKRLG